MTNVPDPDDHTADEPMADGPTTDARLDAAIREVDRFRLPEEWSTVSGVMVEDAVNPSAASGEHVAGEVEPPPGDKVGFMPREVVYVDDGDDEDLFAPEPSVPAEPEHAGRYWVDQAENEPESPVTAEPQSDIDPIAERKAMPEDAAFDAGGDSRFGADYDYQRRALSDFDDGAAEEEAARVEAADVPNPPVADAEPEPSYLPRRIFGLKRALDAHRLAVPFDELPAGARAVDLLNGPAALSHPVSEGPEGPVAEPEPATPQETERSAWSRPWRSADEPVDAEPETKPVDKGTEAVTMAGGAALAAGTATAAVTETERRGWFGSRSTMVTVAKTGASNAEVSVAEDRSETDPFGSKQAPAANTEPPPDKVDLEPVREAMQAAALTRPDVSAGDVAILNAAAGVSDAPAAGPADAARVGVLLINLGTPDAATPKAVRRYLREFLSDRRVIEKDTFVWQLVFKGIILPFRPRSKARAYKAIWNQEKDESPLKTVTRAQAEKLGAALADEGADTVVDWAMRYGNPSIESRIKALLAQGCERLLLVPLYPQYSSATTATVCDEAFRVVSRLRNQPPLRVAPPYYADPVYIEAIASSVRTELAKLSFEPEVIVASYHGMPLEYVQKGDPYLRQCTRTTELLRERLGKADPDLIMTFQSRFGRAEWLQPYTDQTLRKLAKDGVKSVAVVTPGFAADCLETLEEIAVENAHIFKKKGGKNFAFIPCLNDSERGMLVIREIARRELNGWV